VGRAVVDLWETLEAQGNAAGLVELEKEFPPEIMAADMEFAAYVDTVYLKSARAVTRWHRAIRFAPDASRHQRFAWLLATSPDEKVRDPGEALAQAERAVELAPNDPRCWNTLGVARYRVGDADGAIAALRKYRESPSDEAEWSNRFFLAMAHWRTGNRDEARQWYDRAIEWLEQNPSAIKDSKARANKELNRIRSEAAELLGVNEKKQGASSTAPATPESQTPKN
jgi:tetratricopeptide (TPR) repeat protein